MRKNTLSLLLSLFVANLGMAQCVITLQPGPNDGNDALIWNLPCNSSFAQSTGNCETVNHGQNGVMFAASWTYFGTPASHRSLLEFDLSTIVATGCNVADATLILQHDGTTSSFDCGLGSTSVPCNSNAFTVYRVLQPWDESSVLWGNQPSYASATMGQDFVNIPNDIDPFGSTTIDLTDMVNFWLDNPTQNFGLLMRLDAENYYSRVRYATSDNADPTIRPLLQLTLSCGSGQCANLVTGKVYDDVNANCSQDAGEHGLANWIVEFQPGPFYGITNAQGEYAVNLLNDNYTITQIIPNHYLWDSVCPLPYLYNLQVNAGDTINNVDFRVQADAYCPDLWVDVGANFLRPCHTEVFHVQYCNNGNLPADSVYIDIEFDPALTPSISTLPWVSQNGNVYTFWIDSLAPGDCGNFAIDVVVDCNVQIGDIHCVEAQILPYYECAEPADPYWDEASLKVVGECEDDTTACFTITNQGQAMQSATDFRVYVDGILVHTGGIQLGAGADTVICWPIGPGESVILQCDQTPGHPGTSLPHDIVEDCDYLNSTTHSMINSIPADDVDNYVEVECLEVRASYDPNDKNGLPSGFGPEHFIGAQDQIEYKIRFQNTGNDTAFTVVIKDTLDVQHLDITSLQPGVSSHPYNLHIEGSNVLVWTFNNILLVDSATNEPASHGFVKFKIDQKTGNIPGTEILNRVAIYFDFNAPVLTNYSLHTIEYPTSTNIISSEPGAFEVLVYPNPFTDQINLQFNESPTNALIEILDLSGRKIFQKANVQQRSVLIGKKMAKGVYVIRISEEGKPVQTIKVSKH